MGYKMLSTLLAWTIPNKKDRVAFRNLCDKIDDRKKTKYTIKKYPKIILKLKNKSKLKVIFLVNEISKWKAQSLFDLMLQEEKFEPVIALTIADVQKHLSLAQKKEILDKNFNYFSAKNMPVVVAYNVAKDKAIELKSLGADIVFYQQPYLIPKNQDIEKVSDYALTCYIPYYLPDYKNFELDCDRPFHHKLYRFYVFNKEFEKMYKERFEQEGFESSSIKGFGHTMLDLFRKNESPQANSPEYVIYAPHWSIPGASNENIINNISTFNKNGKHILEFAQMHPEINWVFKPHPTLKTALKRTGWSKAEIDNYYNAWGKLGLVSQDSDYVDLFMKSKAMITDSGSFLMEYFVTGKPLLHLISDLASHEAYVELHKYFETFYKIYTNEEIDKYLQAIVLDNNDVKSEERKKILADSAFLQENTAQNIVKDLNKIFEEANV